MSADYYTCDQCGSTHNEDDEYRALCDCGGDFCSENCGKLQNYQVLYDIKEGDPRYQDYLDGNVRIDKSKEVTCVLCRKETFTDYILFEALLRHYNITKDQAIDIWKNEKDDGK